MSSALKLSELGLKRFDLLAEINFNILECWWGKNKNLQLGKVSWSFFYVPIIQPPSSPNGKRSLWTRGQFISLNWHTSCLASPRLSCLRDNLFLLVWIHPMPRIRESNCVTPYLLFVAGHWLQPIRIFINTICVGRVRNKTAGQIELHDWRVFVLL